MIKINTLQGGEASWCVRWSFELNVGVLGSRPDGVPESYVSKYGR